MPHREKIPPVRLDTPRNIQPDFHIRKSKKVNKKICPPERAGGIKMEYEKYVCGPCGYVYDPQLGDPEGGIAPGTPFEELPDDWICPICGLGKEVFVKT